MGLLDSIGKGISGVVNAVEDPFKKAEGAFTDLMHGDIGGALKNGVEGALDVAGGPEEIAGKAALSGATSAIF